MTTSLPILKTKLNRPKCFQKYYRRERLELLLDKSLSKIATLVVAGAGYGKSTLVSQWLNNKKAVWVSCDAEMNQPQVLISYIIEGAKLVSIDAFKHTSSLLQSHNDISYDVLTKAFFTEANEIEAQTIVVLDDFHLLKDDGIKDMLNTFLNYPPKNIHIIAITRHDPSVSLEKHRLNNTLSEIRMQDMNLSRNELIEYAKECFNRSLAKQEADLLLEKTEGWILGCTQLINNKSLNLTSSTFKTEQFNSYFKQEVITRQEEDSHLILFVCSLFNRFNIELIRECLSCFEKEVSKHKIVSTLTNRSNFTISLDRNDEWFRFHHQFQEALADYFNHTLYIKNRIKCLDKGGKWFIRKELYEEGIIKLLEGGFTEEAIKEFQCFRYALLNTDQYSRLDNILALFPEMEQNSNIELILAKAVILENQGKYAALASHIKNLHLQINVQELTPHQKGEVKVWEAMLLFYAGSFNESLQVIDQAIHLMESYASSIITFAYAYKALSLNALGKGTQAIKMLKIRLDSLHINNHQSIARTLIAKAILYSMQSDLQNRQHVVPHVIDISEKHNFYETLGMGIYFFAEQNYRTGLYMQCEKYYEKGLEIKHLMRPSWFVYLLGIHVHCNLIIHPEKVKENIRQLDIFINELNSENMAQFKNALLIEIALRNKEFNKALELNKITDYNVYPPVFYYFLPQVVQLKLLLYTDNTTEFKDFYKTAEPFWDYAKEQGHKNLLIKLNILTAESKYKQNRIKEAKDYMQSAISIAESTGDVMVFCEFSDCTINILNLLSKETKPTSFIHYILKTIPIDMKISEIVLKERDLKLLELVSNGYSNAQIAEEMFLSPDSIKKYLYNLYQELGVKNRTGAVLKAKEIGYLV
ncbi:LuxR C-terminal-related transcriptional regulator [Carboxylicivirga linearis]|uniref:HTH luxR-type domain-containing protein n=1 Tax=Carboxylicivirga linearis TaxID=1628157 RepID=A0ABS5K1V3_9BACT|nr:LuxR C-terminal-related transcriptional regulator [Carboxylicivirga linearis]MBS2101113.1 hypothetical protein [Carboxylicivirga linearis]